MQAQEVRKFATALLTHLGEKLNNIDYLTSGATCSVWKVQSIRRTYALRIIEANERVLDGELDTFVRAEIASAGGRVVQPILNSHEYKTLFDGKRWSLDTFVNGTHPERGLLSGNICRQLGEALAVVHELQIQNFGKPLVLKHGALIGQTNDPMIGVSQRFENPLPAIWPKGFLHPLLSQCTDITTEVFAHLNEVSNVVEEANSVLCHTDIHEKQLICNNNDLAALIDFGDATLLDKHWDFGSIYYFHGEENASSLIEAYEDARGIKEISINTVASFSVAIAMHHGSRSRLPGKEHRLERAARHIRSVIQRK